MQISYNSHPIDLGTVNFDLSYINKLSSNNIKQRLASNMLVVSMLDDKMYYNQNITKSPYQFNNLLYINDNKDIIPLSLNINDINSPLTIDNNKIKVQIDGKTIIDNNKELTCDYNYLTYTNNIDCGLFNVDNESLTIKNDKITLSNNIINIIDNIDDHINIMDNVIQQSVNNLDSVKDVFKEYQLYDSKYSCNLDQKSNIYYFDSKKNNIKIIDNQYIDYNETFFKIKVKIIYNYSSSNVSDFCPFNEKYLNVSIDNADTIIDNDITKYIKFNLNKSYIFNENVTQYDEETNNIFGEINYICYFDIDQESMNKNIPEHISSNYHPIQITINYNDTFTKINSHVTCNLNVMIDKFNSKKYNLNSLLYHDYNIGFNQDGIGQLVGICLIPNSDKHNIHYKPIFMKYFNNENNYIVNRISDDILKNNSLSNIYTEGLYQDGTDSTEGENKYNLTNIDITNESNIENEVFFYKNIDIDEINNNIGNNYFYYGDINYVNKMYNVKNIYNGYLKYAFNDTYNTYGNGLRKGDIWAPCLGELILFYLYGFFPYINYISNEAYKNDEEIELDSSTLYTPNKNNKTDIYMYSLNINDITKPYIKMKRVGNLKINEYGEYVPSEIGTTIHRSIGLFKLPDFSVLSSINYYLSFDEEDNCEVIDYITNAVVNIKIKDYFDIFNINKFLIISNDDNVEISSLSYNNLGNQQYNINFTIKSYQNKENNFDLFYKDSDNAFNEEPVKNNSGYINNYRRLCKISVKIK